jgi:hypothetical protein
MQEVDSLPQKWWFVPAMSETHLAPQLFSATGSESRPGTPYVYQKHILWFSGKMLIFALAFLRPCDYHPPRIGKSVLFGSQPRRFFRPGQEFREFHACRHRAIIPALHCRGQDQYTPPKLCILLWPPIQPDPRASAASSPHPAHLGEEQLASAYGVRSRSASAWHRSRPRSVFGVAPVAILRSSNTTLKVNSQGDGPPGASRGITRISPKIVTNAYGILERREQFFGVERPRTVDVSYPNTHKRLLSSSNAY